MKSTLVTASLTDNIWQRRNILQNWLRNRSTIEFIGLWEKFNNPTFNSIEFDGIKNQAGLNSFSLTPKRWVETTNAIGIFSRTGRYGGTFAHKDIAFEFATWLSAEFKFIEENYQNTGLDMAMVADAVSLSLDGLKKIFQRRGSKANSYIVGYRLLRAKELLRETDIPIGDVAYLCGFADRGHFGVLFRQNFLLTPSNYHNKLKNK